MIKQIKILMIDDHSLIIEGYKNILEEYTNDKTDLIIDTALDCDEGYDKIKNSLGTKIYDVVFLDIGLPPSIRHSIYSGEDLGIKIRELSPGSKLIVLTSHSENSRIYNIMKNLNPESLLIKSDINKLDFFAAFERVMDGESCYSQTVNVLMKMQFRNDILIDSIDRSILYYISKGVRTKYLDSKIPLSIPAIEKRKRNMKLIFGVESGGDLVLIERARELGFL
jgi:DNA-binding NarL/FixJ family response regulator